ncbi:MAG: TIR domain-containing protein [Phycisphaerales bacterium]|nr:TIR domain-containing protein [Phycisphaerales bacterium]
MDEFGVFISYRRSGGAENARLFQEVLSNQGFDVFLDVDDLHGGHFDTQLLAQIEGRKHFLLVGAIGCLDRCADLDDWVRREIAHAIQHKCNLVPVALEGFLMPVRESLPDDIPPHYQTPPVPRP